MISLNDFSFNNSANNRWVTPASPDKLQAAERLLLLSAMPETATAVLKQRLVSLAPEKEGNIIVTSGRIGERSLSRLLGVPYLTILMPKSRAAQLYMEQAQRVSMALCTTLWLRHLLGQDKRCG